jgi:hypothetical protein
MGILDRSRQGDPDGLIAPRNGQVIERVLAAAIRTARRAPSGRFAAFLLIRNHTPVPIINETEMDVGYQSDKAGISSTGWNVPGFQLFDDAA